MRRSPIVLRSLAVARVKQRLLSTSFPRAQMALIVLLTGGFGFLSSVALLRLGVDSMALRYPLALGLAYVFFLFLIWLWLRTNASDYIDIPDVYGLEPSQGSTGPLAELTSGGGGDFGGGGASASFDGPSFNMGGTDDLSLGSAREALGSVAEADELAIPLLAIVFAVGLAVASLYIVYIAPLLFAEILVDAALSYALFRYLRGQDPEHWLASTFRRTAVPFAVTALFLCVTGAAMSAYAPGAKSIGQVVKHASTVRLTK